MRLPLLRQFIFAAVVAALPSAAFAEPPKATLAQLAVAFKFASTSDNTVTVISNAKGSFGFQVSQAWSRALSSSTSSACTSQPCNSFGAQIDNSNGLSLSVEGSCAVAIKNIIALATPQSRREVKKLLTGKGKITPDMCAVGSVTDDDNDSQFFILSVEPTDVFTIEAHRQD